MVVLISVVVLTLLGLLWWWVVQPHGPRQPTARDFPLPLFTTRTPGHCVPVAPRPLALDATESGRRVAAAPFEPDGERRPEERAAPPADAERPLVVEREPRPAPAGAAATGRRNGRGAPSPELSAAPTAGAPAQPSVGDRVTGGPRDASDGPRDASERWARPAAHTPAGTIQFLPGRLEVLHGRAMAGQEVRFVRPERPGERAVVTFGRGEGAPYRHVQLNVPTVSRLHARMSLEPGSGTWKLENLSTTNPVAVNGADLPEGAPPLPLADGDRVEMGEIVFTFRAR